MASDSKIINALMLESPDSSGILARLHRLQKGRSSKWSMQPICRKVGIPSTGYFSDVVKGKRSLHPKYLSRISKAFGLDKLQQDYLSTIITVQKAAYEAALPTLKTRILNTLVDLDSSNGDQLVKFNMQLFPYDPEVKDTDKPFRREFFSDKTDI